MWPRVANHYLALPPRASYIVSETCLCACIVYTWGVVQGLGAFVAPGGMVGRVRAQAGTGWPGTAAANRQDGQARGAAPAS